MRHLLLALLCILVASAAQGKIYKWVDDKGTVHFSDTPLSEKAKPVSLEVTGITIEKPAGEADQPQAGGQQQAPTGQPPAAPSDKTPQKKVISEDDYRITASVGKLGGDAVSINGRISSGPICRDMVVTATARNDNDLSATVTRHISKTTSQGSTIFEGTARVSGSKDDRGFWKIDSVKISCND